MSINCFSLRCLLAVMGLSLLASCGGDSGKFVLEGRLRHMNQAEFWVYSPDGAITGFDTITVSNGRFTYEKELRDPATLVVIFPNFSEQPVFAEPGATVYVKGDASHLKEMTIEGTDDNETMTELRMQLNETAPPDIQKVVAAFIKENLNSPVSIYLLKRYFVLTSTPNYQQARNLAKLMLEQNPESGQLIQLVQELTHVKGAPLKSKLPPFTATDLDGRKVTEKDLKAKLNVLSVWATWNYNSNNMQQRLKTLKERYKDKLGVVSVCIDASPNECRRRIARDSLKWSTVCDGRMWDTPLLATFGLADVPANVVIDDKGIVIERNLQPQRLEDFINTEMLKYNIDNLVNN